MRGAMATYIELQKQIESLQREAETLRAKERKGVIVQMKEAIAAYGISASELGLTSGGGRKAAAPGRKTKTRGAAKRSTGGTAYADAKGNTWGGRGKRPNWLREALANGAKLEDFAAK